MLYDYGARFYDPSIMSFNQPDTLIPDPYNPLDWNRYSYSRYNPVRYIDPTGHRAIDTNTEDDNGSSLDDLFEDESPEPDAPPDFDNPLPNGNPPHPNINGLPDNQWEWNDNWPDLGPGYRNKADPTGTVWRPDDTTTGELPHWHGRVPGERGPGRTFPPNYKWGRGDQPSYPGVFNPATGRYESSTSWPSVSDWNIPRFPPPNPNIVIPSIIVILLFPVLIFGL